MISLIQALHGIAATAWVGGIFFAYMALRPAANKTLEPAQRIRLWQSAYSHFFPWVWLFIATLLITGYVDLFARFGGLANQSPYLIVMHITGLLMVTFFCYLYFILYRTLTRHVTDDNMESAVKVINKMRPVMALNLSLGIFITAVGISGSYF